EEGLSSLIDALATAGPDAQVWNWVANGPGPSTFWHRRMAQETSIHRWDAENAVGQAGPIDTELALDGIDEALDMLAMRLSMQSEPELSGKLALAATDAAWACTLQLAPDAVRRGEGADGADSVVRGTASDLHLWLTGRRGEGSTIVVEGDHAAADALGRMKFG
ncbi:MAG TPA: maleylpyruvate isomerase family mycothiol-dependent enzyme, partial [Acidimicrobiales bacterium]|nr:maleylpyruvate isomerase family mycothiol-dependent enzyme [Acidimicrobiales bacterium]